MIGFVIKLVVVLVVGVLTYNYFFGDEAEKAQSSKVFGQMKDVAVSVGELARSEKEKFDAGKYDAALEKLGEAYKTARDGAQHLDAGIVKRLGELEKRKTELREEVDRIDQAERAAAGKTDAAAAEERRERRRALDRDLEKLLNDSNALLEQARGK
jgi:cytochrome c556